MTILIADAQQLTASGLVFLLSQRVEFNVVNAAPEPANLTAMLERQQPDVLIIDYNIPGFFTMDDIRSVSKISPQTQVLIISSDNDKGNILAALEAGIKGYITKESSREEIMMAIHATAKGEKFFCHKVLDILMEKHLTKTENTEATVLTTRETEILKLIALGNSTLQIADELHLSTHTVHTHRKNITRKLKIKSPTQFVIYALDLGIIKSK